MAMQVRNTILIVDDMATNRIFMKNVLKDEYELLEAANGDQALQQIYRHHSKLAAVMLDIVMPGKNGYQVLDELRKMGFLKEFPVVIISADSNSKSEARALELGASDMISKPYDPYILKRRVANLVELFKGRRKLENRVDDLSKVINTANTSVVNTLAAVTEFRSLESGQHILRIKVFAEILLKAVAAAFPEFQLDERKIDLIASASVLHDVGKVMIPDNVLNKPGKLTKEEFKIMKSHTTAGCEILSKMSDALDDEYMQYAYNICRYHHERWDGRGYPDGLHQDNIPLCAQVVSICDVYDALTTPRVYKAAFSHEKAVDMILKGECGQFNPAMLECFFKVLPQFKACAKRYADQGGEKMTDEVQLPQPIPSAQILNTSTKQLAAAKYQTILQLVDGIIIEADMDTGLYQLVYDNDGSFPAFRKGKKLNDMLFELLNTVVHPEDKRVATEHLLSFQKDFFEQGLRRLSKRYRVRSSPLEEYFWVEGTTLRITTGSPNERKAICVWQKLRDYHGRTAAAAADQQSNVAAMHMLPGVALRCRNDRWRTIEQGQENLTRLLGYSVEELERDYQNRMVELILPEDREVVNSHLKKEQERGNRIDIEYRMRHKDGSVVWVLEKNRIVKESDGIEHLYRILLDNTSIKKEIEELQLLVDRYHLLFSHANEMFFEWDLQTDEVSFTNNFQKTFGYAVDDKNFSQYVAANDGFVYQEDLPLLQKLIEQVRGGKSGADQELRIMKADGSYLWCRLRMIGQQHENGSMVSLLGTITDINSDKLILQDLQHQSERDALTELYNREAATKLIEMYLQSRCENEKGALLVLDIDNFKKVNDQYGHTAGDTILISSGDTIRGLFRADDIVARLGGDEFMVLLKNISDKQAVVRCAEKIVSSFQENVASQVPDCHISCSIGAAILPADGDQFDKLFVNADKALLSAKENGKNQVAFFSEIDAETTMYTSTRTAIESDKRTKLSNQNLTEHALSQLYQSGDVEGTIQSMLEMVGRQLNVCRVYIFENSADNRFCSNTFEWCKEGVVSEIANLQELSYADDLPDYESHYNAQDAFCCRDVSTLPDALRKVFEAQDVKSMIHCAIRDGGVFRGFVGFDDCTTYRVWTQEQTNILSSMAEVLGLFLLKKRAQDHLNALEESLRAVFNSREDWIYAIDPETHKVLFVNDNARKLVPELCVGTHCYKAMMGQAQPCEDCPVQKIKNGEAVGESRIANAYLGKCVHARASRVVWKGKEAILIACAEEKEA